MHIKVLGREQKELLELIGQFANDFYLVGGTALALQWGHRQSIDFDLFSGESFDNLKVREKIHKHGASIDRIYIETEGEFTLVVEGVKTTFYHYMYEIEPDLWFEKRISMPDDLTLGAMKAFALGRRAKWKDYVDLYFLLKKYRLEKVVEKAVSIYSEGEFNERLLREQLAYYGDIDYGEPVEYMPGFEVEKGEVKDFLKEVATR